MTGPMSSASSGTVSAYICPGSGLSTPAVWLSSSRTVMVSSARRTARRWSLAGLSRPIVPSATSRSTAVAVTSMVRPGAGNRWPGSRASPRSRSAQPAASTHGRVASGSPPAIVRAARPSSATASAAIARTWSGTSPWVLTGGLAILGSRTRRPVGMPRRPASRCGGSASTAATYCTPFSSTKACSGAWRRTTNSPLRSSEASWLILETRVAGGSTVQEASRRSAGAARSRRVASSPAPRPRRTGTRPSAAGPARERPAPQ